MDSEYIKFSSNKDSDFYLPERENYEMSKFEIPTFSDKDWYYTYDKDWIYVLNKNEKNPPKQGWKIHLTTIPNEASSMLYVVADFLLKKQISFKFIPSLEKLIDRNSKGASRVSSGKFVTIYPHDTKIFLQLLKELNSITKNYSEGPYILNDKQWKNSNVFFRYGGFQEMLKKVGNKLVDAIQDEKGDLVPDKRVPYYYLPKFVSEPKEIINNDGDLNSNECNELDKYNIESAISFSNAGGIYKARINGEFCILKEGRPRAGIDSNGSDGFSRILHEYNVIKQLSNVRGVVRVKKYFKEWKHNYIEEEYLEGNNLDDYIASSFPFVTSKDISNLKQYVDNSKFIIEELIRIVDSIHKNNIAIGDLQPSNVIFDKNSNTVNLIDFEEAATPNSRYNPGLMTPGFVSIDSKTFGDADWFAVYKIMYYLFLPVDPSISDLSPQIINIYDEKIQKQFGKEVVNFLHDKRTFICRNALLYNTRPLFINESFILPKHKLNQKNRKSVVCELRNGIMNNIDFNFNGLIRGDIRQYENSISMYSIAFGAFGGIMAMLRSGGIPDKYTEKMEQWFSNNLPIIEKLAENKNINKGLFTGLTGISSLLFDIGQKELAVKFLKNVEINNNADDSLYSGTAGIGIAEIAGYSITRDKVLLLNSKKAASILIHNFLKRKRLPVNHKNVGLLDGLTGEALFLLLLGKNIHNEYYTDMSVEIMDYVVKNSMSYDDTGNLLVNDTSRGISRLLPYLNSGSAGIAYLLLLMSSYSKDFLNSERNDYLQQLIKSSYNYCCIDGSLIDGYAGFIVLGSLVKILQNDNRLMDYLLDGMNSFMIGSNCRETYIPGNEGLKLSMDYETGASGVILSLILDSKDNFSYWLPLPINSNLFQIN